MKVVAKVTVKHCRVYYTPGDVLELPDDLARSLIETGKVVPAPMSEQSDEDQQDDQAGPEIDESIKPVKKRKGKAKGDA